MGDKQRPKGFLAWFASNHVAANLLMLLIMAAGLLSIRGASPTSRIRGMEPAWRG